MRRGGGATCLAGALALSVWGVPAPATAGEIAGTVEGPSGPLAGPNVFAMENSGNVAGSAVTNGAGQYTITGLAADSYFVHASVTFGNPDGLVGETYSGVQCTVNCDLRAGTEVAVGAGTTPGIDFHLRLGGTIEGTVTAAGSGTPVAVTVQAFDLKGRFMGSANSSGGSYTIQGLPPGPDYLVTFSAGARADQLHPGLPCGNNQCDIYQGTAVSTDATGVNFVLAVGGSIAGTIRGPGALPLEGARVEVWQGSERFGIAFATPASGQYTIGGLPVGNGFRVFARKTGLVAEVFPDSPCPAGGCSIGFTGTGIDIPTAGAAITGKDVQLAAGHSISGTLAPVGFAGVVQVFGSTGLAGSVNGTTNYTVPDPPDGVYQVRASINGKIAELYDNHPCPGACPLGLGDDVTVAGANVTGVNFGLETGFGIHGTVRTGANGDPVAFLPIEVLRVDGVLMSTGFTFLDGTYGTFEGLPPGNYYVRTRKPPGLGTNEDQI